jgi:hypothetical protein
MVSLRVTGLAALAHALLSKQIFQCGREFDWLVTDRH